MQTLRQEEAKELLRGRIAQGEPRPQIYYYLAVLQIADGNLEEALATLDQGLASHPEDVV